MVYRFGLSDQVFYPRTLGARTADARLALDPPWVTALCAGMIWLRVGSLLRWAGLRRAIVRLFGGLQTVYVGQDTFAISLEVHGASGTLRLSLAGRDESAGTALGAALMAHGLYEGELRQPGVWLPEQVIPAGPFLEKSGERRRKVVTI